MDDGLWEGQEIAGGNWELEGHQSRPKNGKLRHMNWFQYVVCMEGEEGRGEGMLKS